MSQLIQHYQTSFSIRDGVLSSEEKFFRAQYVVGEWIKDHESKRYKKMGYDQSVSFRIRGNFKYRALYESKHSWCKTNYCILEGSKAWAVEYTHRDSLEKNVFWVTEIGLRGFTDEESLVVCVKISYKITSEFAFTGKEYVPSVSIPWVVDAILSAFKDCRFYSGDRDVTDGIRHAVQVRNVEDAQAVCDYLFDPDRKLGVALLVGETKEIKKEADYLSKNLFGKAIVYIIPYDHRLRRLFHNWRLEFNQCVFIPSFLVRDQSLVPFLHYCADDPTVSAKRHAAILRAWLSVHPVNERGAVTSLDNVGILIRKDKLAKLEVLLKDRVPAEEYERLKSDLQEMSGLFTMSEEENRKLENEKRQLNGTVKELQDKNLTLEIEKQNQEDAHKSELYKMRAAHAAALRKSRPDEGALPRDYPDSFQSLQLFTPFYKHLAFARKAWEPALSYDRFNDFKVAWEMLFDLDQILWSLIFEEGGDIERKFEERSTYEYAKGEGSNTTNNSKLAALRRFEFEGKTWEMWAHIKYHNMPGRQLRIHFAVDNDQRRLIVGYIGEHLDNATTRTRH